MVTVSVVYRNTHIVTNVEAGSVSSIIRQLCVEHLHISEPAALFALRVLDTDELVTDENLPRKLEGQERLKLVSSPVIEAAECVDKLSSGDDKITKLTIFNLQRLIREVQFADEFLNRGGLRILMQVIRTSSGNTLAYALTSLQNLLELDHGWDTLDNSFINRVVDILVKQALVNICRPATGILIKLVTTDQPNYGFSAVYKATQMQPDFYPTLVQRLGSGEFILCVNSLSLINAMMRHVSDEYRNDFHDNLEGLNLRRAVSLLMNSHLGQELSKQILEFQSLIIRQLHEWKQTPISLDNVKHREALDTVWKMAGVEQDDFSKWRRIGFATEAPKWEMSKVGYLGLDHMRLFALRDEDLFAKIILEQINRPENRRCPFARTSMEVTDLLCEYWDITTGFSTSTSFQPLLLSFSRIHYITVKAFFRLWHEMEATLDDFPKVSNLVRSQIKFSLRDEATKPLYEFEKDMLDVEYKVIRDRQMKELELGDDLMSKVPVRNLRGRLYKESYEYVKQQRIKCLVIGAWFQTAAAGVVTTPAGSLSNRNTLATTARAKRWRFYRLSPNRKYLHYGDFFDKTYIRPGLEDLPERIDLALVTDVVTGHAATHAMVGAPPPTGFKRSVAPSPALSFPSPDMSGPPSTASSTLPVSLSSGTYAPSSAILSPATLSFSLMSGPDTSLADFVALNWTQFSEWTDGFNMLFDKNIASPQTAEYIHVLTEVSVRMNLLDLSGERIDIPQGVDMAMPVPPAGGPSGPGFYYDDPF